MHLLASLTPPAHSPHRPPFLPCLRVGVGPLFGTSLAQVSNLMAPSPEVKQKRMATMAALTKLREAEQMLFEVAQMDSQVSGPGLPMQPF